ncbi:MAG: AraC family transcriptional regulator [Spirochaetes bacterium]|nr:AraC family transcriptional regulator [Spirochaetota bacterium]
MKKFFVGSVCIGSAIGIIVLIYSCESILRLPQPDAYTLFLDGEWDVQYCAFQKHCDHVVEKIYVPAIFTSELLKKTNNYQGIVVLSKRVYIPRSLHSKYILLSLGKIGDADRTYVNGMLVGSSGGFLPHEFSVWNKTRYYLIPFEILRFDEQNTIKIEIACYGFNRIVGKLFITPISAEEYNRIQLFETAKNYFPLFCNVGIGFIFLIIFLMLIYNKNERSKYLWFLAQLVPGIFVVLEPVLPYPLYHSTIMRVKVFGISWSTLVLVHLIFLHRLYGYRRIKTEIALHIVTLLVILSVIVVKKPLSIKTVGTYVIVTLTSLAAYNVSLHIEQILKKNSLAKLFIPIGLILAITAAHDGFVYLSIFTMKMYKFLGYEFRSPIFHFTSIAIFVGAGLIVVYQYIEMSRKVERINVYLENKVKERTRELHASLENLSKAIELGIFNIKSKSTKYFSPQLEPKIKHAIVYINNNYKDDISREGLASMLNIHHDYFSKAFKYYTGKSVNEYIYSLRIKEAIRLLIETNETILDIAMQVGFDSVKTFNRAFKRLTGKNPREYRK